MKDVFKIRYLRIRKFKREYRKLLILTQIIAIWYAAIISASILTSSTSASFSDTEKNNKVIQAGTWWDESKLSFLGKSTENMKVCPPTDISVEIKNSGFTMVGPTEYEVYYSENGNPKQTGEKIAEGQIQPIKENGTYTLSYPTDLEGSFMFKAYQRPGYGDNYEVRQEFWSNKIMVNCEAAKEEKTEEKDTSKEQQEVESDNQVEEQEQPVTEPAENKKEEKEAEEKTEETVEAPAKGEETKQPKEEEKQPEEPVTPSEPEEQQAPAEEKKPKVTDTPTNPEPVKKEEKKTEEG
jgi:YqxM protein